MNHSGHDMDHNGKVTLKDNAMFHEMMDDDTGRRDRCPGRSTGDIVGEGVMLLFFAFVVPLAAFYIIGGILSLFH